MSQAIRMPAAFVALRRHAKSPPEPELAPALDSPAESAQLGAAKSAGPTETEPDLDVVAANVEPTASLPLAVRTGPELRGASRVAVFKESAGPHSKDSPEHTLIFEDVSPKPTAPENYIDNEIGGSDTINESVVNVSIGGSISDAEAELDQITVQTEDWHLTDAEQTTTAPTTALASSQSPSPSVALTSDTVDVYGFKKYTQYVTKDTYDQWWGEHAEYLVRRREKWAKLLEAHGLNTQNPVRFPPKSTKLKRYIRKGIPVEWRGNAWFWFARGPDKLKAHPGLYSRLAEDSKGLKNNDTEHIERDLYRTFPDNIHFRRDPTAPDQEPEKIRALRQVLTAFSVYQPNVGYCQSLNFLAGTLLLFLDEEKAFWMLVIITQNYLAGLHEVNLEQVNISQGVLMVNVRDRLPKVWDSFALDGPTQDNFVSNLPPISLCTASWFMSMFVCILPTETMLRVWDVFFFEGPSVMYRVALTLFKLAEPELMTATDDMEVFQKVQVFPRTMLDPAVLLGNCFRRMNGFGHPSPDDIKALQQFVATRRKINRDAAQNPARAPKDLKTDREEYSRFRPRQRLRSRLHLYN